MRAVQWGNAGSAEAIYHPLPSLQVWVVLCPSERGILGESNEAFFGGGVSVKEKQSRKRFYISEVVNKAGLCRLIWLIFMVDGIGMMLDGFDYMIVSYTMIQIAEEWGLDAVAKGSLTTWSAIGLMVGSIVGGTLSDRIGRRKTMVLAVFAFSIFTIPIYFAPNYAVFAVLRICAGLGLGAFFPVSATLVSEFAPTRYRAVLTGLTGAFQTFGWVLAGVAASAIVPEWGWRPCYLVAAIGVVFVLIANFVLPESPYWLMQKGRKQEACDVVARICQSSSRVSESDFDLAPENLVVPETPQKVGLSALFSKDVAKVTLGFWLLYFFATFIVYGINPWLPSLLVQKGSDLAASYGYSIVSNVVAVVSCVVVGFAVEYLGRRRGIITGFCFAIVGLVFMSFVQGGDAVLLAGIVIMSLGTNYLPPSIVPACTENYSTLTRNTGVGWMQSVSRIAGITAPLFVGALVGAGLGFNRIFMVFVVPAVLGMLVVVFLIKKETKGLAFDKAEE